MLKHTACRGRSPHLWFISRVVAFGLLLALVRTPSFAGGAPQIESHHGSVPGHRCADLQGHELPCPVPKPASKQASSSSVWSLPKNFLIDQKALWTSPARIRQTDLLWMIPVGGFTAGLIASDTAVERHLPDSPTLINHSRDFANAGVAALGGTAAGLYLWGRVTANEHHREAGILSVEALANALVATTVIKSATRRARPLEGNGKGEFWNGGNSFPSDHAVAAWSIASVIAQEYPGPLTKLLAYGTASAVTLSRITGRDHFPSDALVGSTLGWLMGRYVYGAHHDSQLPGAARWGTFSRHEYETARSPGMTASAYVPLDSWVYAAFERLQALGYARSGMSGLRPWTRSECARLVQEAGDVIAEDPEAGPTYEALKTEFSSELRGVDREDELNLGVESMYTRVTGVSGPPLNDGYHFAQTNINDFGRPTREGTNVVSGLALRGSAGPVLFYARGEYQHAPSAPRLSDAVTAAMNAADGVPFGPGTAPASVDRFRLLDGYVAVNIKNFQLSFGKQSLWWGPGYGGTMLFTNNVEPIPMLRIDRVAPFQLPGPLAWLGKIRLQVFWGELQGYNSLTIVRDGTRIFFSAPIRPHPYIGGEKISFAPTPNLQFAVSVTTVFGGPGYPLTFRNLLRTYAINTTGPGVPGDPGDRRSGFEFSYRIPGLRNWLVLYNDSFVEDEFSPIAYPRYSAMNPGIYLPQIPGAHKLDLRVEGVYTDLPQSRYTPGVFYANNGHYSSGYTNEGNIIGSWVGREGWGLQAWTTYRLSPQSTLQGGFRRQLVNREFLGGGDVRDFSARVNLALRSDVQVTAAAQYERWAFPLLAPAAKSNVTTSVELSWHPKWRIQR